MLCSPFLRALHMRLHMAACTQLQNVSSRECCGILHLYGSVPGQTGKVAPETTHRVKPPGSGRPGNTEAPEPSDTIRDRRAGIRTGRCNIRRVDGGIKASSVYALSIPAHLKAQNLEALPLPAWLFSEALPSRSRLCKTRPTGNLSPTMVPQTLVQRLSDRLHQPYTVCTFSVRYKSKLGKKS
jgi:hypothetical protein